MIGGEKGDYISIWGAIAEAYSQYFQNQVPASLAAVEARSLANRLDQRSRNEVTVAVTLTAEGKMIVTQSRGGILLKPLREGLPEGAIIQTEGRESEHAELKVINSPKH